DASCLPYPLDTLQVEGEDACEGQRQTGEPGAEGKSHPRAPAEGERAVQPLERVHAPSGNANSKSDHTIRKKNTLVTTVATMGAAPSATPGDSLGSTCSAAASPARQRTQ